MNKLYMPSLVFIGLLTLALGNINWTLTNSAQHVLQQQVPSHLAYVYKNRTSNSRLSHLLNTSQNIPFSLDHRLLPVLVSNVHLQVLDLESMGSQFNGERNELYAIWQLGGEQRHAIFKLHYQINWLLLLPLVLSLTLGFMFVISRLPKTKSKQVKQVEIVVAQYHLTDRLTEQDISQLAQLPNAIWHFALTVMSKVEVKAETIINWLQRDSKITKINKQQLDWFSFGLVLYPNDLDKALNIALSDDEIHFYPEQHTIVIKQISIVMSSTPFLYYLWYAQLRLNNEFDGWLVNPSINRPDTRHAGLLLDLMRQYDGKSKAINEIVNNGIKAKVLTQNRNKIKEEITSVIPDSLSANFLFESDRDLKSGRYKYRLTTSHNKIKIHKSG